jgi:hypothetical protein
MTDYAPITLSQIYCDMHTLMNDLALLVKRSSWTKETANIHRLRGAARDCYVQFYNALNTASSETIKKLDALSPHLCSAMAAYPKSRLSTAVGEVPPRTTRGIKTKAANNCECAPVNRAVIQSFRRQQVMSVQPVGRRLFSTGP